MQTKEMGLGFKNKREKGKKYHKFDNDFQKKEVEIPKENNF